MARRNVAPPATLDHKALAKGLGRLMPDGRSGYGRIVVGGKTLAYLKRHRVIVPAALAAKAAKRLGAFTTESNGRWAGVTCADTAAARAVLEYVAQKAGQA